MKQSTVFLMLMIFTIVIAISATLPIIDAHQGLDISRFIDEINVNPSTRFLSTDLGLAVLSFIPFMYYESKRIKLRYWALPLIGMFLVGACLIFPWFFYRRAKHLEV